MGILYVAYNGAAPTTAAFVPVTTGTAIKTLLQIATPSTKTIKVVEWGISMDGSAAATPTIVELLTTGSVNATVTAHVAAGVAPLDQSSAPASLMTLGTAATGYTASAEGTITATHLYDVQHVATTGAYVKQFPLGREPHIPVSTFLRIRVDAASATNAICYVVWEE